MKVNTEKIGPLVKFMFEKELPGRRRSKSSLNVYRLGDILFDTGSTPASEFLIEAITRETGPPERIVLTHQHEDHIGGLNAMVAAWGELPVFAPREHLEIIADGYPVPDYRVDFWGRAPGFSRLIGFDAGAEFEAAGLKIEILETPGHTVGHKSFVIREGGQTFILSGDLYLAPRLHNAFYETSVPDMLNSLNLLRNQAEEFVLCPSHGGPFADGARRVEQLAGWYQKEQAKILAAARENPELDYNGLFKILYGHYNAMEIYSSGELSRAALIRGVTHPVRKLPAEPIQLDPGLVHESRERLKK